VSAYGDDGNLAAGAGVDGRKGYSTCSMCCINSFHVMASMVFNLARYFYYSVILNILSGM